jgi:hypothetical protein
VKDNYENFIIKLPLAIMRSTTAIGSAQEMNKTMYMVWYSTTLTEIDFTKIIQYG